MKITTIIKSLFNNINTLHKYTPPINPLKLKTKKMSDNNQNKRRKTDEIIEINEINEINYDNDLKFVPNQFFNNHQENLNNYSNLNHLNNLKIICENEYVNQIRNKNIDIRITSEIDNSIIAD